MNIFDTVAINKPKKNSFDLSHEKKLSCNPGKLIPVLVQEILPGDSFRVKTEHLVRMAPMLAPVMHRFNFFTHYFFVPNRIIWNEWEKFITGGEDGLQEGTPPYFTYATLANINHDLVEPGSLLDYLGVPTLNSEESPLTEIAFSSLPFRAYQQIFNDYYRDENLQPIEDYEFSKDGGAEISASIAALRNRSWEKDYFTSALPWAQKGAEVLLPLQGEAPVNYKAPVDVDNYQSTVNPNDGQKNTTGSAVSTFVINGKSYLRNAANEIISIQPGDTLFADLTAATQTTINDFRTAFQLQRWLEKNARGGSRYTESNLIHFGVKSSDARLQRAEYLGGGKSPLVISEVLQTSQSDLSPQGNMAGHGIGVGETHQFVKSFEEHGWVIGIMSIMPRTAYQQGLPRAYSRFDKFDYFWPTFENLGEQAILNQELYFQNLGGSTNGRTFGYTPRYADYRFNFSSVHGEFKSSLAYWHAGRIFANAPDLNESFITCDEQEFARIFNVEDPTVHKLYVMLYHNIQAIRPMSKFGEPGLIDHG